MQTRSNAPHSHILYNLILGAGIALGLYFGVYRMILIPMANLLYASRFGMLTMAFAVECILVACGGLFLSMVTGLIALGLAILCDRPLHGTHLHRGHGGRQHARHTVQPATV